MYIFYAFFIVHFFINISDKALLQAIINEQIINAQEENANAIADNNNDPPELDNIEAITSQGDEKEIFNWPDKAVMLFLEIYREKEEEFIGGKKRHNKLWSEIAHELQKSNYNVSGVQVQNKMSSLKRAYKKIKDLNAKSGNQHNSWTFYCIMESIFGKKTWISPPAIATSEGPIPSTSSAPCNFVITEDSVQEKSKKRKADTSLDSFLSYLKENKKQKEEERKKEQLEREERRRQQLEREEKRQQGKEKERERRHNETSAIQKSMIDLLSKFLEKK